MIVKLKRDGQICLGGSFDFLISGTFQTLELLGAALSVTTA